LSDFDILTDLEYYVHTIKQTDVIVDTGFTTRKEGILFVW
jgi:hypothetical protein